MQTMAVPVHVYYTVMHATTVSVHLCYTVMQGIWRTQQLKWSDPGSRAVLLCSTV